LVAHRYGGWVLAFVRRRHAILDIPDADIDYQLAELVGIAGTFGDSRHQALPYHAFDHIRAENG
jgi:hypothetical protein